MKILHPFVVSPSAGPGQACRTTNGATSFDKSDFVPRPVGVDLRSELRASGHIAKVVFSKQSPMPVVTGTTEDENFLPVGGELAEP